MVTLLAAFVVLVAGAHTARAVVGCLAVVDFLFIFASDNRKTCSYVEMLYVLLLRR